MIMKTKKLIGILSLLGVVLTSCTFRDDKQELVWSKWHDNGDGTHSRHNLNDITVQETKPHTFTLSKVVVAPTDVTPGKEIYKCDLCGAIENRDVAPTGNYVFDQEVVDDKYVYERCSDHSAIYYKSTWLMGRIMTGFMKLHFAENEPTGLLASMPQGFSPVLMDRP